MSEFSLLFFLGRRMPCRRMGKNRSSPCIGGLFFSTFLVFYETLMECGAPPGAVYNSNFWVLFFLFRRCVGRSLTLRLALQPYVTCHFMTVDSMYIAHGVQGSGQFK